MTWRSAVVSDASCVELKSAIRSGLYSGCDILVVYMLIR